MVIITANKDYSLNLDMAIIIPIMIDDIDKDLQIFENVFYLWVRYLKWFHTYFLMQLYQN